LYVNTLDAMLDNQRMVYRLFGPVFGIFALAALLMAAVGLYAVMSQSTGRRTREIGIRMALGATPARILRLVMRTGAIQLGLGLVLGLSAAMAVADLIQAFLFVGVAPRDPLTLALTSSVLTSVGLLACWIPARRAARIAPVRALAQDERR
jgi:putative ABC transport system permease protein